MDEETVKRELTYYCKSAGALGQVPWARMQKLPQLRQAFGISEGRIWPGGALRVKLRAGVRSLLRSGSDDHRRVLEVAMGLDPSIQHDNLTNRLEMLAAEWNCGVWRIRERKDEAITLCAQRAVSISQMSQTIVDLGYVVPDMVTRFKTDLDRCQPTELVEWRKIMAEADPLEVIAAKHGVLPAPPGMGMDEFEAEILGGGELIEVQRWPGDTIQHRVRPPYSLNRGDVHAYGFQYRFRPEQPFNDYFRVQPAEPHMLFETVDLAVEFVSRRPSRVWKLNGATPRATPGDPNVVELSLDESGIVREFFNDLLPGRVYGIGWSRD